jgi:protease-4
LPNAALTAITALALICAVPGRALAQAGPLPVVGLPATSIVDVEDASAIQVNPAAMLRLSGPNFVYHGTFAAEMGAQTAVPGSAFWLALPLGPTAALGFGYQEIPKVGLAWPRDPAEEVLMDRFTISFAGGDRAFSTATSVHFIGSDNDDVLRSLTSWDMGLQASPMPYVQFGATLTDFTEPRLKGDRRAKRLQAPLQARLGLGIRPGTDRLTLAGEALMRDDGDDNPYAGARGSVRIELPEGLHLRGGVDIDQDESFSASVTVGFDLANLGVAGGTFLRDEGDGKARSDAVSITVRASAERYPALFGPSAGLVELSLSGSLPERRRPGLFSAGSGPTLPGTLLLLDRMRQDPDVGGVLLRIHGLAIGFAQAQEIRSALDRLRAAGKKVLAHVTTADHKGYLIASAADEVRMHPGGSLMLLGLSTSHSFIAKGLSRIGVEADFIRIGKWKTAPDALTREDMSEAHREAENALLDAAFAGLVSGIATGRGKSEADVRTWIDEGPYDSSFAKEKGLVDAVGHWDEWREQLIDDAGHRILTDYGERRPHVRQWGKIRRIAIIHVDGAITSGEDQSLPLVGTHTSGAATLGRALDGAREDDSVVAVVLRVNSPGGSATASETIYRHAKLLADEKPLIISMGNVAASGGYYIAAAGHHILADPGTITGSIGIFAGKINLRGLWDLLSIRRETLKRGKRADILSSDRAFTEEEKAVLLDRLTRSYKLFTSRVAEGRKMSQEEVDTVAQGRVWIGSDAKERKLVDQLGGLLEAIEEARTRAGLEEGDSVEIVELPRSSFLPAIVGKVQAMVSDSPDPSLVGLFPPIVDLPPELHALWPLISGQFAAGEPLFLMDPIVEVQ